VVDSLSVIGHVLETSAIATESINSRAMLFKDEFVIMAHAIETRHYMSDFRNFRGHYFFHYSQLKMGV
jgi:hypothetical protein